MYQVASDCTDLCVSQHTNAALRIQPTYASVPKKECKHVEQQYIKKFLLFLPKFLILNLPIR